MNELHQAARDGSTERTLALLSNGSFDINQGTPEGWTPLMCAAVNDQPRVVSILLSKGANVAVVAASGYTALHCSARQGSLAATTLLAEAGSDLEAAIHSTGATALHLAGAGGHSEVVSTLLEAGAIPNSRGLAGETPLYFAAQGGRVGAVKVLLRSKADPLVSLFPGTGRMPLSPFDTAAGCGHTEVVRELLRQVGIKGCSPDGGVQALQMAAQGSQGSHLEIMGILSDAGVEDNGGALMMASTQGREASVKFLLLRRGIPTSGERGCVNVHDGLGQTPLSHAIESVSPSSARIARFLIDAGADATSAVRFINTSGEEVFNDTLLALTEVYLSVKKVKGGKDATEDQLHSVKASRRLLLQVEAVHAVSWLWRGETPSITPGAAEHTTSKIKTTALISMLPTLRRRARRPNVLLSALFRNVEKS